MKYAPNVYRNNRLCVSLAQKRGMRQRSRRELRYKERVYGVCDYWVFCESAEYSDKK